MKISQTLLSCSILHYLCQNYFNITDRILRFYSFPFDSKTNVFLHLDMSTGDEFDKFALSLRKDIIPVFT